MELPTYLLFGLGWLGAADILFFHSVAHGIRSHADSVKELLSHSLRGPTYALLFILIPNFALRGRFAWAVLALLICDIAISIWDFSLEGSSRRRLGGLPSGEYVLHMLMAMVFGAMTATWIAATSEAFKEVTELVYAPARVPVIVRFMMSVMAILVLVSGVQDALAAFRLHRLKPKVLNATAKDLSEQVQTTRLMQSVLVVAGIYNLGWGSWVAFFPAAFFRWLGVPPLNYPPIWQCVGMIVGVYGIGYLLAAQAPLRHWPITLVGLLGKMLGPIGMWWAIRTGQLPVKCAWACLANDILWWVPFGYILIRAWTRSRALGTYRNGVLIPQGDFT